MNVFLSADLEVSGVHLLILKNTLVEVVTNWKFLNYLYFTVWQLLFNNGFSLHNEVNVLVDFTLENDIFIGGEQLLIDVLKELKRIRVLHLVYVQLFEAPAGYCIVYKIYIKIKNTS